MATVYAREEARELDPLDYPVRDTVLPPAPSGPLTVVRERTNEVDDDALRWLDEALAEEIDVDAVEDDFDDRLTPPSTAITLKG